MKFIDLIKLATRMFKARTSRTVLTIVGIGVGTATILFLISLGFGVQEVILSKITTSDSLSAMDIYPNSSTEKKISWESVDQISYIKNVEKIAPLFKYDGQIRIEQYNNNTSFLVTGPGFIGMDGKEVLVGEDLSKDNPNGIILAASFSRVLEKSWDELIGKEVEITLNIPEEEAGKFREEKIDKKFKIIGIAENEKSQVYVNLDGLDRANLNNFSLIKAKSYNSDQVEDVKQQIEALGYKTSSVSEVVRQARKFFSIASLSLAVLGVIALLVSSIGMFNTMVITLLERTEEIGIMKAIGATDQNILSIFIFESALMGFLGGVCGIVMGFMAQFTFNFVVNFIAVRMGGEAFKLFHSPFWFILLLVMSSLFIGILTGSIPARKASAVDPLEALKRR